MSGKQPLASQEIRRPFLHCQVVLGHTVLQQQTTLNAKCRFVKLFPHTRWEPCYGQCHPCHVAPQWRIFFRPRPVRVLFSK